MQVVLFQKVFINPISIVKNMEEKKIRLLKLCNNWEGLIGWKVTF